MQSYGDWRERVLCPGWYSYPAPALVRGSVNCNESRVKDVNCGSCSCSTSLSLSVHSSFSLPPLLNSLPSESPSQTYLLLFPSFSPTRHWLHSPFPLSCCTLPHATQLCLPPVLLPLSFAAIPSLMISHPEPTRSVLTLSPSYSPYLVLSQAPSVLTSPTQLTEMFKIVLKGRYFPCQIYLKTRSSQQKEPSTQDSNEKKFVEPGGSESVVFST